MYPQLTIDVEKITNNTKTLVNFANRKNVTITGITKCTGAHIDVAKAMLNGGATALGDSRIQNFKKLESVSCPKWLIRIPMLSETIDVVKYTTLSLNSELALLKALNSEAMFQNTTHDVLLMVDLGDLREGFFNEYELLKAVEFSLESSHLKFMGIGTNLCCVSGVLPTLDTYKKLETYYKAIEKTFNIYPPIVSGGSTSSYPHLINGTLPPFINNLRIGELILNGTDTSNNLIDDHFHHDAFLLGTEIVEIKEKPSLPIGKIGRDAFGNIPSFEDKGMRLRAICALGKQDTLIDNIYPVDTNIEIVAASSDHLVLDITNCTKKYNIADIIHFNIGYQSNLHLCTTDYIEKVIKHKE